MATCRAVRVPGPQGAPGTDGTNGTNGWNAFSILSAATTIPAAQTQALFTFTDPPGNRWMEAGQIVAVQSGGSGGTPGYYRVMSFVGFTQVNLLNLRDDTTGAYATNLVSGTFVLGMKVGPGGLQGPPGDAGTSGAPADATYLVKTADASLPNAQALADLTNGVLVNVAGVVAIAPQTTANLAQAPNDGALTAGQALFATAAGIGSKTAADARTALGLGTMATQDANAVNITGGTIGPGVTIPSTLPTSIFPKDWLLYRHELATGTNAGTFTQGSWQVVPLTVEVVDTGNYGTIAANVVTLQPGTYRARWRTCGYMVDAFQSRLYNVSTASVVAYGSNAEAASTDASTDYSHGEARFTIAVATQLRLEAQCGLTNATGFGKANNFGGLEIFAALELEREAS